MTTISDTAAQAAIGAAARELRLPTVRDQAARLAEIAVRERHTHLAFLAEILAAEVDDRSGRTRARRIAEARFPRIKRLAEFHTGAVPTVTPAQLAPKCRWVPDLRVHGVVHVTRWYSLITLRRCTGASSGARTCAT